MPTEHELAERVTELEVKYAYSESRVHALDEVVREFAERVERLEKQLAAMAGGPAPAAGTDERPPHY
jgi:uncharacterized coiled-coil protein SlyX